MAGMEEQAYLKEVQEAKEAPAAVAVEEEDLATQEIKVAILYLPPLA
jgi:hypothetical protein